MAFWKRLESRLARYAIPNLTAIIIAGQVLLYFVQQVRQVDNMGVDAFSKIYLEPAMVLEGEVWRLFTFAFVPPQTMIIWALFYWLILYMCGTALENQWGVFRYNLYIFVGLVANIAAAFVAWSAGALAMANNQFLYMTVFLAFARLFPETVFQIYFILPVKVKWLALLTWFLLGYAFVQGPGMSRLLIVASVFNYLVFFGREHVREVRQVQRRRTFANKATPKRGPTHQCRVCGLNSDDSPRTSFRYCSKCAGQCCYCPEHIQNHEHVREAEA